MYKLLPNTPIPQRVNTVRYSPVTHTFPGNLVDSDIKRLGVKEDECEESAGGGLERI
jgi:hypothetical protein